MRLKRNTALLVFLMPTLMLFGQSNKVWVSGAARAIMYGDNYTTDSEKDTTTAGKLQSGHALVDLGVNIQPNEDLYIIGMVRVRNDYGGFWGSGVTFDVRQLTVKGILGGFLKYQLGDIDYRLSDYTFANKKGLINQYEGVITGAPQEQIQYDLFYMRDQTWRQQGAAIDFALLSEKGFEEMQFDLFTTRIQASDLSAQDDRLYSGGSVLMKQSKHVIIGAQYAKLYDFKGTSNSEVHLRNSVLSGTLELRHEIEQATFSLGLETGMSSLQWEGDEASSLLEDYFYDVGLTANHKNSGLQFVAKYRDVGANFRSAGAQTLQIDYDRFPITYQRIGNDKALRPMGMMDIYRDASLYQTQIQEGLMSYDPRYDNATPYGVATPNRKGFNINLTQTDKSRRWVVGLETEFLSEDVGEGTTTLRDFQTFSIYARLNIHELAQMGEREAWISGRFGSQTTKRSGNFEYEVVDLATDFLIVNVSATLIGDLDFIAEYRLWATKGFELLAERDAYSQIIDFNEYELDYSESIMGIGLQHEFTEKNVLRLMWQSIDWKDNNQEMISYSIGTWSLFFTMKF